MLVHRKENLKATAERVRGTRRMYGHTAPF
jgi:hypothetical protein